MSIIIIVIHNLIYLAIHCVQCQFQYVVMANCMLCVFHRELTSEALATYQSWFSIPVESILLLLGSRNKGIVVQSQCVLISVWRLIKCTIHQPPVLCLYKSCTNLNRCSFYSCTVLQYCSICQLLFYAMLLCYSSILHYQQSCYRCEYDLSTI